METTFYDQIVPRGHFLRHLQAVIPWEAYGRQLIVCYKGAGEYGRPPWDPVLMLKVLLFAHLYTPLTAAAKASKIGISGGSSYVLATLGVLEPCVPSAPVLFDTYDAAMEPSFGLGSITLLLHYHPPFEGVPTSPWAAVG